MVIIEIWKSVHELLKCTYYKPFCRHIYPIIFVSNTESVTVKCSSLAQKTVNGSNENVMGMFHVLRAY